MSAIVDMYQDEIADLQDTIYALKAELASLKGQEPACYVLVNRVGRATSSVDRVLKSGTKLYPAAGAQPADFDEWMKNPYTQVLMKSIETDYHPKAGAQERKPLSHDQIVAATSEINTGKHGYFIDIARAIEAAHGIKEQP